ncbi:DNA methyltransferase [Sphingomonas corticis]|jgi:site-specific DNA-methyltransferase (adenine-specific)|uniref:Methyltransferase n=1 Tax=Sphingomonas corticis TaxID=2722791 RepID=A0ABX1CIQ3_9SPHN|nr:DNA methyltransferase [Sphingomonas corticis]NJR77879.1 site-specific DNA-methyltransferase [Sphingomonas corticis]
MTAAARNRPANHLYYGDNLEVLRREIGDASVDLIYLDPPFNSNANYNILFRSPTGDSADAQIEAFEDTWHWNDAAEDAFDQVARSGNTRAFDLLNAMRAFLGENDMMAYLAMMAVRMIELHRVLKPTGSLYLHCDPTAGHYLKLLLDGVFGARAFRREIVWRSGWVSGFKTRTANWIRNHDTIFYYVRDPAGTWTFNKQYVAHEADYVRRGGGENPLGKAIDDVWDDPALYSPNIKSFSSEKLGYPTQKPVALLERIVSASSNAGDVVLDPFCGCGTAVHAAQKLGRQWIGIDVTHLAISLIEKRMQAAFPDAAFTVEGTPRDLASAEDLARRDKYQFQWWVVSMIDAMPHGGKRKGADGGIDGIVYFKPDGKRTERALVSVKGGDNVGVQMIRDLHSTMEREKAPVGIFVTKALPTAAMEKEAAAVGRFHAEASGRSYPRLQIITLAELMRGKRPDIPYVDPTAAFRRAAREETGQQGSLL